MCIRNLISAIVLMIFFSNPVMADITISRVADKPIVISTDKYEDEKEYYLEISILGRNSGSITLEPHGEELVLAVQEKGVEKRVNSEGSEIHYTYSFGEDAKINQLVKLRTGNIIKVSVPKY